MLPSAERGQQPGERRQGVPRKSGAIVVGDWVAEKILRRGVRAGGVSLQRHRNVLL